MRHHETLKTCSKTKIIGLRTDHKNIHPVVKEREREREREGERNSARCTKARNLCMDAWATACTAKPVYIYIYANACTRVVVGVGVGGGVGEGVSVLEDQLKSR